MTAITASIRMRPTAGRTAWIEGAFLATGLVAIVVARWAATRAGFDALGIGAGFGLVLGLLVTAGGFREGVHRRSIRQGIRPLLVGALFGSALVAVGTVGPSVGGGALAPGLGRPAAPFVPWALVTTVVAVAEEAILRGVLFGRLQRAGGAALALAVTTTLFALMHVPLHGWHVVPLDLAVGLGLGGLRLSTRSVAAPAAAHVVADLATWWL